MFAEGCAYDFIHDKCTVLPDFESGVTDCEELDGYYFLCIEEPSCGFFNKLEGTCGN